MGAQLLRAPRLSEREVATKREDARVKSHSFVAFDLNFEEKIIGRVLHEGEKSIVVGSNLEARFAFLDPI